jgi:hypothetical protein
MTTFSELEATGKELQHIERFCPRTVNQQVHRDSCHLVTLLFMTDAQYFLVLYPQPVGLWDVENATVCKHQHIDGSSVVSLTCWLHFTPRKVF